MYVGLPYISLKALSYVQLCILSNLLLCTVPSPYVIMTCMQDIDSSTERLRRHWCHCQRIRIAIESEDF